jgi:fluoroacetyl-CoA thioesterase
MSRPGHLNAPWPIILRTRGDGTLAAACAAADDRLQSTPGCGNDGSHIAGFSSYIGAKESKPMKPGLQPGASRVNRITIGPERTIGFMGEEARTYATPAMIRDIEYTCRDFILEHADPGEDSVGMEVAIKHLAPTLLGMTVEIAVRVLAVDGRKVAFEVAVKDELDTVGAGTHTRFVVDKAKTFERIKAKAARFAARSG